MPIVLCSPTLRAARGSATTEKWTVMPPDREAKDGEASRGSARGNGTGLTILETTL